MTHREIIRRHSSPLEPKPTDVEPVLRKLDGIRAVLFDVYGTMLISGSGDLGTVAEASPADAFRNALAAMKIDVCGDSLPAAGTADLSLQGRGDAELKTVIARHHESARQRDIEYPEVDIVAVWRELLDDLQSRGDIGESNSIDCKQLAIEYEVRCNPVWPMPHLAECLKGLRRAELALGIVSNAQFFTPELFPALLESTTRDLGFSADLEFFSYQHGRAKPDVFLYQLASDALKARGFEPTGVLYVGNDMLNDITPASRMMFRTALFAGDARSLRLRDNDPRVTGVTPDLVLTDLNQLIDCVC